jgi:hypothetical protein
VREDSSATGIAWGDSACRRDSMAMAASMPPASQHLIISFRRNASLTFNMGISGFHHA